MQDNSFKTFQAVLNVPKLSDIRAYGTKDSLTALSGDVVGYLNHSRMDEIAVNCKLNSTNAADLTVSEETFGCEDWNVYVKLFKFLVVDKDNEAFGRILLNSNNKCYVFRKGAVVEIESTAKLDDVEAECVRPRGDPNCYWMASRFSHISR